MEATNREEHAIATSLSGSPKLSKSWKSGAFSILYTDFLPIPKKEEVVSHPERAQYTKRGGHRMILQALHADKRLKELGKQGRIIIKTSDTDVIVLCIYFACLFSLTDRNFFQSGIFLPSMTWNTFVWAVTLVRRAIYHATSTPTVTPPMRFILS
jgi:hypothetical protein